MAIKDPVPGDAIGQLFALDGGATIEVGLIARIIDDRGAPPIGQRRGRIVVGQALVAVGRENIFVFVGVELHVVADLFEIVQTGNAQGFVFGAIQGGQQHRRQNGDDGNDHEQFDEREAELAWRTTAG